MVIWCQGGWYWWRTWRWFQARVFPANGSVPWTGRFATLFHRWTCQEHVRLFQNSELRFLNSRNGLLRFTEKRLPSIRPGTVFRKFGSIHLLSNPFCIKGIDRAATIYSGWPCAIFLNKSVKRVPAKFELESCSVHQLRLKSATLSTEIVLSK